MNLDIKVSFTVECNENDPNFAIERFFEELDTGLDYINESLKRDNIKVWR